MASDETAALVVALSAQVSKFQKDLDDAAGIADRSARRIEDRFANVKLGSAGLDVFSRKIAGLVSAVALGLALKQIADLNEEVARIGEGAARVGLTTDEYQKFRFAVVATGGSLQQADNFLDVFSRKIAEAATGTGALYKFLETNNVALHNSAGELLPLNELLNKYANLVKNTKSPQDQLNEVFMVAGRQAGPALVAALKEGSEGLRQFGIDAENAGVIIDAALIERARIANEKFQEMKLRASTIFEEAAVSVIESAQKTIANMDKIGQGWSDSLKAAWAAAISYIETHSPDASRIVANLREAIANAPLTGAPLTGRAGADITAPLSGATDPRFLLSKTPSGDASTKQYNALNDQISAFDKATDAANKHVAAMLADGSAVGKTEAQHQQLREEMALLAAAQSDDASITDEQITAYANLRASMSAEQALTAAGIKLNTENAASFAAVSARALEAGNALTKAKDAFQGANDSALFFGHELENALSNMDSSTKAIDLVRAAVRNLANELIKAAITGEGAFAKLLGTNSSTGGAGGFAGLFAALIRGGGSSGGGGSYALALAGGTDDWRGGKAIVGEAGEEVVSLPDGRAFMVGQRGAQLLDLPRGTQVIPHQDIPRFAQGGVIGGGSLPAIGRGRGDVVNNVSVTNAPAGVEGVTTKQNANGGVDMEIVLRKYLVGAAQDRSHPFTRTLARTMGINTARGIA